MTNQMIDNNSKHSGALPPSISQVIENLRKEYMEQPRKLRRNKIVLIDSIDEALPEYNIVGGCSYGLWEGYKHPNFFVLLPGNQVSPKEMIHELVARVAGGHVFSEDEAFGTFTLADGKKLLIRGILYGKESNSVFNVVFFDENGEYVGYPTIEQLTEMGLLGQSAS